jgi:hypothetical protein
LAGIETVFAFGARWLVETVTAQVGRKWSAVLDDPFRVYAWRATRRA